MLYLACTTHRAFGSDSFRLEVKIQWSCVQSVCLLLHLLVLFFYYKGKRISTKVCIHVIVLCLFTSTQMHDDHASVCAKFACIVSNIILLAPTDSENLP